MTDVLMLIQETFGLALLAVANSFLPAVALAIAVWGALRMLPRLNAATRYAAWWAVLAAVMAGPLIPRIPLTDWWPAPGRSAVEAHDQALSAVDALPASTTAVDAAPTPGSNEPFVEESLAATAAPASPAEDDGQPVSNSAAVEDGSEPSRATPVQAAVAAAPTIASTFADAASSGGPARPLAPFAVSGGAWLWGLLAVWAGYLAYRMIRIGRSYLYLRGIKHRARRASREQDLDFGSWLMTCGVDRPVKLLVSSEIASPMAVGFRRPAVMLPEALLAELDQDQLDHVLLHELAHIARLDDWTNLAAHLTGAVLGLHPVAAWALRQIGREREIACDDWVVATTGDARPYAASLTRLFEACSARRQVLAQGMADRGSHLGERIERLLEAGRQFTPRLSWSAALLGLVLLTALVIVGAQSPQWVAYAQPDAVQVDALPAASNGTGFAAPEQAVAIDRRIERAADEVDRLKKEVAAGVSEGANVDRQLTELDGARQRLREVESLRTSTLGRLLAQAVPPVPPAPPKPPAPPAAPAPPPPPEPPAPVIYAPFTYSYGAYGNSVERALAGLERQITQQEQRIEQQKESLENLRRSGQDSELAQGTLAAAEDRIAAMTAQLEAQREALENGREFQQELSEYQAEQQQLNTQRQELSRQLAQLSRQQAGLDPEAAEELRREMDDVRQEIDQLSFRSRDLGEEISSAVSEAMRGLGNSIGYGLGAGISAQVQQSATQAVQQLRESVQRLGRSRRTLLAALSEAGYTNLSVDQIIQLREAGVTASLLDGLAPMNWGRLSTDELKALVDAGVNGLYLRQLEQNSLTNLTREDVTRLAEAGVRPSEIKAARDYDPDLSVDEIIRLKEGGALGAGLVVNQNPLVVLDPNPDPSTFQFVVGVPAPAPQSNR